MLINQSVLQPINSATTSGKISRVKVKMGQQQQKNTSLDLATCTVASKEPEINYRWILNPRMREIWKDSIVDSSRLIFAIFRDNSCI